MLAGRGYEVVAVSGKPEADEYLRELGAARILRRQEHRPRHAADGEGAVGRRHRQRRRRRCSPGSRAPWTSGATSPASASPAARELKTTVMPFILRGVNLLGINSVLTPRDTRLAVWKRIAGDLRPAQLDRICRPDRDVRRAAGAVRRLPQGPRHRPHRGEDRMNDVRSKATRTLTHLQRLEAESIHIMREVVAECEQAGDALLDRQGQRGDAAPGAQGLLSRASRRSRCCTSTRPGSSGTMYEFRDRMAARARHGAARPHQPGGRGAGHQPVRPRLGSAHRREEDRRR